MSAESHQGRKIATRAMRKTTSAMSVSSRKPTAMPRNFAAPRFARMISAISCFGSSSCFRTSARRLDRTRLNSVL